MHMGTYSGPRVAGLNPYQTQGADYAANFANQYGQQGATNLFNAGSNVLNAGQNFGNNAQQVFDQASGDPTQQILANANSYANNPYVDGLIDASSRDVTRNLYENQLPGVARAAAGTGNTNSTRAGVESAIAQRGAADRLADTASNIRSQFFGKGLDMSQNQYNQDLATRLQANGQLQGAFTTGQGALLGGQQMAGNNFDFLNQAGSLYQGQQQKEYDAAKQAFTEQQNVPLDLIAKYQAIVGGSNYGNNITTSTPTNVAGGALGGGMAALGLYGKLGGFGKTTPTSTSGDWLGYDMPTASSFSNGGD
jgi:hypothetical protein